MATTSQAEFTAASACLQRIAAFSIRVLGLQEVLAYLDRHPDMTDLVEKVAAETEREFGDNAELTLGLYRDPEIDDEYLIFRARQAAYGKDFMNRIEAVRARYREALSDKTGWLHVTTDFCPPGTDHAV